MRYRLITVLVEAGSRSKPWNRGRPAGVVPHMKLKVRVVHYRCQGRDCWYADIDDADDRQPDDPYWYVAGCASQCDALDAACRRLVELARRLSAGDRLTRVSGSYAEAA